MIRIFTLLTTFFLFSSFILLFGCSSKEISRSSAQKMIETSSDLLQPYVLPLTQGQPSIAGQGSMSILEDRVETAQEAERRKVDTYFEIYPQIAVAHYLGLVEVQVKSRDVVQPKHEHWMDSPIWWFDEKYTTSDKGKELWKNYNLPPSNDSIPLAKKEFVEVTGITKQSEDVAQAQFTWKFLPNDTARYFDSATTEFQTLPAELQQRMLGRQPATIINRSPKDQAIKLTDAVRQGQAAFRRYDDGWRLISVIFQ